MRSKIESLKSEALPFLFENYKHLHSTGNVRSFRVKTEALSEFLKTDPDTIATIINSLRKDGFITSVRAGRTAKEVPVAAGYTSFTTSMDSPRLTEPAYLLELDGLVLEKAVLANEAAENLEEVIYNTKTLSYGKLRPLVFHKLAKHEIENRRTKFMNLYWQDRLERRGTAIIKNGRPIPAETVAANLGIVIDPLLYLRKGKKEYKEKLKDFVKNFNNELKDKCFPMRIVKKGGIQIVIDYP